MSRFRGNPPICYVSSNDTKTSELICEMAIIYGKMNCVLEIVGNLKKELVHKRDSIQNYHLLCFYFISKYLALQLITFLKNESFKSGS